MGRMHKKSAGRRTTEHPKCGKTANDHIKEFCEVLQGKGKAYFVNIKNFENHDVNT